MNEIEPGFTRIGPYGLWLTHAQSAALAAAHIAPDAVVQGDLPSYLLPMKVALPPDLPNTGLVTVEAPPSPLYFPLS